MSSQSDAEDIFIGSRRGVIHQSATTMTRGEDCTWRTLITNVTRPEDAELPLLFPPVRPRLDPVAFSVNRVQPAVA